ncbi:hypothetical protein LXA43DRAFT_1094024 [Ganoderma leucocontextum]|nr:hypothetical protein LXA43DRAFT_1094024 [Ganoderma leucocontextum]
MTQPVQVGPTHAAEPTAVGAPTIAGEDVAPPTSAGESPVASLKTNWDTPLSERIAVELIVPLLPAPRALPPDFSLGRLKQTASRLFVALEPIVRRTTRHTLSAAPALGLQNVWGILGDYKRLRKVKKSKEGSAKNGSAGAGEDPMKGDDVSGPHSVSFNAGDTAEQQAEETNLKRLKNIFLWREPTASAICGAVMLGGFILAIPESERRRLPSPLSFVPSDTEYAMELISQRVARRLPVKARRKRPGTRSSDSSMPEAEDSQASSSSVDWQKVGERIASTKEMAGDYKGLFREGQWKKTENWKALNPLAPKVVTSQNGDEPRIETQSMSTWPSPLAPHAKGELLTQTELAAFPATMRSHGPGLITLTLTSLFFTSLLSPQSVLTVELADITGVKNITMTRGLELVGSRSELFARLTVTAESRISKPARRRLAATLRAKSSFKKLPKRSVLTADISQLCGLIAEPPEPLALRLSSNLMIGVARPEALTLVADPEAAFDSVFVAWDERIQEDEESERGSDDEFDPKSKKPKSKGKQKQNDVPSSIVPEHARALHTLAEDHKHLLTAAFDGSLTGGG